MPKATLSTDDDKNFILRTSAIKIDQPIENASNRPMFMLTLSAKMVYDLMDSHTSPILLKADEYRYDEDAGYQRPHSDRRSANFANFVRGETFERSKATDAVGWCPTSVTLFLRDRKSYNFQNGNIEIKLNANNCLYIPDGQHRLYGLAYAYHKEIKEVGEARAPDSKIAKYELPAVLICSLEDDPFIEEAQFFHTINTEAKRVPTNLANKFILEKKEETSGKIDLDESIPRTGNYQLFIPFVVKLVIKLNENGVWKSRILMPGQYTATEDRAKANYIPVNQVSFISSIKPFVKDECSKARWSINEIHQVVDAFWLAISRKCPKAISYWRTNRAEDKSYYLLRSTMGIYTLNLLLGEIVTRTKDDFDVDRWEERLDPASEYICDDFWLAGNPDGCSKYGTSMKSFKSLMEEILNKIP